MGSELISEATYKPCEWTYSCPHCGSEQGTTTCINGLVMENEFIDCDFCGEEFVVSIGED